MNAEILRKTGSNDTNQVRSQYVAIIDFAVVMKYSFQTRYHKCKSMYSHAQIEILFVCEFHYWNTEHKCQYVRDIFALSHILVLCRKGKTVKEVIDHLEQIGHFSTANIFMEPPSDGDMMEEIVLTKMNQPPPAGISKLSGQSPTLCCCICHHETSR